VTETDELHGKLERAEDARDLAQRELRNARQRLSVAEDLLHDAWGVIANAENFKNTLICKVRGLDCPDIQGHPVDELEAVPIGPQEWRDAATTWRDRWHKFMDGNVRRRQSTPADVAEMRAALEFAVKLLRDETGPGGLMEREPVAVRQTWQLAMDCLESARRVPLIPVFEWRRRYLTDTDAQQAGDMA
jgi:hypothetical protein